MLWIDYLIHVQNYIGDTRMGLVLSEVDKKKRTAPVKIEDFF